MMHPNTSARGITHRELFMKSSRRIITDIVQEQVREIDAAILRAHTAGFGSITHELPTVFGLNNVDKADAQVLIYSEILLMYRNPETMGGKGFSDTYIDLRATKSMLIIHWQNGMDDDERRSRLDVIKACNSVDQRVRK